MITTKAKLKNFAPGLKYNSDMLLMAYSSPRYCTKPLLYAVFLVALLPV